MDRLNASYRALGAIHLAFEHRDPMISMCDAQSIIGEVETVLAEAPSLRAGVDAIIAECTIVGDRALARAIGGGQ